MLMNRSEAALLVIDVQERLLPHMHEWQRLLENIEWLVRLAQRLEVPLMVSEQYPKGLGRSRPEIAALVAANQIVDKLHFSCVAARCLEATPVAARAQVVVAGIESHVCVLQTALELHAQGKEVFVVADAVGSRDPASGKLALARMRQSGVHIVSREMVGFEWLRQAGTDLFRDVSRSFLR